MGYFATVPKDLIMDNLGAIFGEDKKLNTLFVMKRITAFLEAHWPEISGKLAKELKVSYFRDGVLVLESSNQMWVNEIGFYHQDLLNRISEITQKYGRKFKVFKVRVVFRPPVLEKESVSLVVFKGDFLEKLKLLKEYKLKKGMRLCSRCGLVYTMEDPCITCGLM
jgi:hypothetical protein